MANIQLGLCCINLQLRNQETPIWSSRSMIVRTINEQGIDKLKEKIIQNLKDTIQLIHWNHHNGIKVFRLSSELFPHKTNPLIPAYDYEFAKQLLLEIGSVAMQYNQRITFHPGHFNVIGTPNQQAFQNTINDLTYHADLLDLMQLPIDSVMVVHGGGKYGNKQKTMERWCSNFFKLPKHVQKRLVLENCEKNFSIEDCLFISHKINIPVVFDIHHYNCYKLIHPIEQFHDAEYYIPFVLYTWQRRGIKPKFHISEQGVGKIGHHSDFIESIPQYLLDIPQKYNISIDIMIEAKMKELAIFKLYNKYQKLFCNHSNITIPGHGWATNYKCC